MNVFEDIKKLGGKEVFIIGHANTDVDSYISMLLGSATLRKAGVIAKPSLFVEMEELDPQTFAAIQNLDCPRIKKEDIPEDALIVLVDHNDVAESIPSLKNEQVVGIFDHHQDQNIYSNLVFKKIEHAGSCSTLIFKSAVEEGLVPIPDCVPKLWALFATGVDTCGWRSSKTTKEDIEDLHNWCKELMIPVPIMKSNTLMPTDLKKSIEDLAYNGRKFYDIAGKKISSSYIEFKTSEDCKTKGTEVCDFLESNFKDYLHIILLVDFESESVQVRVFGEKSEEYFDLDFDRLVSRGNDVMPRYREAITDYERLMAEEL